MRGMTFFLLVLIIADTLALGGRMRNEVLAPLSGVKSALSRELRIFGY